MTTPASEMLQSNMDSFIAHTTPRPRCHLMPKRCIWNSCRNKEMVKYFTLEDLWACYEVCSAYGLGCPMQLDNDEPFIQYYAPSLSAVEVYTLHPVASRSEIPNSSTSNESGMPFSPSNGSCSKMAGNCGNLSNSYCLSAGNQRNQLYCRYIEDDLPHHRVPLFDKINELAEKYPGLKSLKSVDISPSSWMAVAWYPIYAIPRQGDPKLLYAAFITYHAISSSSLGNKSAFMGSDSYCNVVRKKEVNDGHISIHPFGLATYKTKSRVWINTETANRQRIVSLLRGADSWVKLLPFEHPDYKHFRTFSHPVLAMR